MCGAWNIKTRGTKSTAFPQIKEELKQPVQFYTAGNEKRLELSSTDDGQHVEQTQSSESKEAVSMIQISFVLQVLF